MGTNTLLITAPDGQTQRVRVSKPQLTLGRSALSDVVIHDPKASRSHARLHFADGVRVEDLGSANGTLVGDTPITSHRLLPGEVIRIGGHRVEIATDLAAVDFDRTVINSEREIDATLVANPLDVEVNDTSQPRLAVMSRKGSWEVPLTADVTTLGRGSDCHVVVESRDVSRTHAQIERVGDGFRLRDLQSSNGTWMNGRRIEHQMLQNGDTFLIGDARCVYKAAFTADDLTVVDDGPRRKRRPVVIVPGMMGSTLMRGSELIWPNVRLMLTEPDLFRYPGTATLTPGGLVSEIVVVPNLIKQDQYNRLTEYLSEGLGYESGNDMLEFPYDWRQDVRISARQLGAAIEKWGVREPITIVAHSLGTLVSRYYLDCLGGSKYVDRIVFLGAAHYGVPKSIVILSQGPGFLPFGLFADKMRSVLSTYPAAHQILPTYPVVTDQHGNAVDVLADERWLPEQQRQSHAIAREFRRELPDRCSVSAVSIFGYGLKTVTSVTMCRNGAGLCDRVDFVSDDGGDAMIPQVSSILKGTEIHPVRQNHGVLHTDKDVQMRLKVELTR
jgi:pSer/pThr/pTyr-binding forkhead associated (FHA) protein/pimeloyl-ACP methyl ester carboxylesterase